MSELVELCLAYGEARRVQLTYRRQWAPLRCEFRDEDTAACYIGRPDELLGNMDDYCETCQKREPIHRRWRQAKKEERTALVRLQRQLIRAAAGT